MLRSLYHCWRLFAVVRTMSRYRVLQPMLAAGRAPFPLKWAISSFALFTGKAKGVDGLANGERLARALEALGPAYVKLGQAMATRPDMLGVDMSRGLAQLQDKVGAFPTSDAKRIIEEDLGEPVTKLFREFGERAIAAASIAQVHRATTSDGREVAVKVLRPGIKPRFRRDLSTFRWAAGVIERYFEGARRLRPIAVVDTLADSVALELDLRLEAAGASELSDAMSGDPDYKVPEIDWARTSERILTTEWMDGVPLTDTSGLEAAGIDRKRLAEIAVEIFLKQAMRDGYFHADMHQGNLIALPDGRLGAVDFGIMGRLDRDSRRYLAEILYGFITRDYRKIADMHFEAGYVPADRSVDDFATALRAIGEPIMGRPISQISIGRLLAQLLATTETFDMRTQPHLIMLQKTMVMVEGVAFSLDRNANMWEIAAPVLEGWAKDNLSPEVLVADEIRKRGAQLMALPDALDRSMALLGRAERLIDQVNGQSNPTSTPGSTAGWVAGAGLLFLLGLMIGVLA
ncbi:MAG: 2-polyprenylphenol 6-hydroxylase [Pseudomonadota bacterium]